MTLSLAQSEQQGKLKMAESMISPKYGNPYESNATPQHQI